MTTAVAERTVFLPWHHFLDQIGDSGDLRIRIDGFRKSEWDSIRNDLKKQVIGVGDQTLRWEFSDSLEPHWVDPGKAVYWQQQITRKPEMRKDEHGNPYMEAVMVLGEWKPTGPLPANNWSQIAHYLGKGFRLRPPVEGISAEALIEASIPAEALQGEPETEDLYLYSCNRHKQGMERRRFRTWKSYVQHCSHYSESVEEKLPEEVVERMKLFPYYCAIHDKGFKNEVGASRHMRVELSKRGRATHPPVDSMKVQHNGQFPKE
jgi:hypothetical protein